MSLIVSRKANETIEIGDNITVTVLRIHNGQVRLAINAPGHVKILRAELTQEERNIIISNFKP